MPLPHALLISLMASCLCPHADAAEVPADAGSTVFDLSDVIPAVPDFSGTYHMAGPSTAAAAAALPPPAASPPSPPSASELRDAFLRRTCEPGMADLIIAHSTIAGSVMTVTATPALRSHLATVLAQARAQLHLQIHTDLLEVMMDPALRQRRYALTELGWQDLPGCPGLAFATLTPGQVLALRARWSLEAGINLPFHPSLTSYSGQGACCNFKASATYPKLTFTASGPAVAVGSFDTGDSVTIRSTATADHRFLHLVLEHERVSLMGMTPVTLAAPGDAAPSTTEVPQLAAVQERLDQVIEDGTSVIIATSLYLGQDQPPRAGFLIVTSQILTPPSSGSAVRAPDLDEPPPATPLMIPLTTPAANRTF